MKPSSQLQGAPRQDLARLQRAHPIQLRQHRRASRAWQLSNMRKDTSTCYWPTELPGRAIACLAARPQTPFLFRYKRAMLKQLFISSSQPNKLGWPTGSASSPAGKEKLVEVESWKSPTMTTLWLCSSALALASALVRLG